MPSLIADISDVVMSYYKAAACFNVGFIFTVLYRAVL